MAYESSSRSGFSVVVIVVLVVLISLLGFVGWNLWETNRTKQVAPESSNYRQGSSNEHVDQEDATKNDSYFKIEELGIKIKFNNEIKDAIYTSKLDNEQYPRAFFSTQTLSEKSQQCSSAGTAPPLGSIMVTKQSVNELGAELVADGKNVLKLDDTFVVWQSPQAPCSTDSIIEELASKQRSAFKESFKTVQLDL